MAPRPRVALLLSTLWRGTLLALARGAAAAAHVGASCAPRIAPPPGGILVDVRAAAAFSARHLRGASSIPLAELEARLFELPAPSEDALALCGADATEVRAAYELLAARGWSVNATVDASDEGEWRACADAGWREAAAPDGASAPSWRPNLFLRRLLPDALAAARAAEELARCVADDAAAAAPGVAGGGVGGARIALDLGAGNGRDAVGLADALGEGWEVHAVDNHLGALARCAALAARAGVSARVRTDARDLRRAAPVVGWTDGRVRLAHGSRFLVKPLLAMLRDDVLLEPGALFVWSTFLEPADGEDENRAPPFRPSRRLRRGELASLFCAARGWRVLADDEGELVTRGERVPAAFFAAVRAARDTRGEEASAP